MGFWIFMLVMDILIPFTMIVFGCFFKKNAPKDINYLFGYRTKMSMKNKDTWEFAHLYIGNLWLKIGWILLFISFVGMLLVIRKSENIIGTAGGIICNVQLIFLVGTIFPTEAALKKMFDKNGLRRK